jgi:NAD-dependent dihydropyrimidine dehydrogenase PreA subunit
VLVDQMLCTGCGECVPYCPVGAIRPANGAVEIDFDECVECTTCIRFAGCPVDAIQESPETARWPREVRRQFSDPMTKHPSTGGSGRGTEEMKTNDVTGRVRRGEVGIGLEFGRPGVGTRLSDLEKMSVALAKVGVSFEPDNPVTALLANPETGEMKPELRNERVLSAIIEVHAPAERLSRLVPVILDVATRVDTVISWEVITRMNDDGTVPVLDDLLRLGLAPRPNAKVNLGMGLPLAEE